MAVKDRRALLAILSGSPSSAAHLIFDRTRSIPGQIDGALLIILIAKRGEIIVVFRHLATIIRLSDRILLDTPLYSGAQLSVSLFQVCVSFSQVQYYGILLQ
jgi:hypothetical protein